MGNDPHGFDDPSYWNWLSPEKGEELVRIRQRVTQLHENRAVRPLRFYTTHSLDHARAVEDLIHRLIPRNLFEKLDEQERFYLLASAWLHDIGMLSTVAKQVLEGPLDDNEIRSQHHVATARFILSQPHECGVDELDKNFLANLCLYHRRRMDLRTAHKWMVVRGQRYRLRLLAAYLRLADALHVDMSRAPDQEFALCLAFNIPPETKLHWIKSRLVSGICPDAENNRIIVQFQRPDDAVVTEFGLQPERVEQKIDAVIRYVMDEMRDELASVMHTLAAAGISYYLDMKQEVRTGVDPRTLKNLMTMVMNYDVLVWPSASRLLNIVLENLAEISGHQLQKAGPPVPIDADLNADDVATHLERFTELLTDDLDSRRRHHLGIRALLEECQEIFARRAFPVARFVAVLDRHYKRQIEHRNAIRKMSADHAALLASSDGSGRRNVLLYGYSELVIKALCGLRDGQLKGSRQDRQVLYGTREEAEASRNLRIFICDGQHKTHTAVQDRLLYHDGMSYAFALRERCFTNLVIIPDIVIGAVLSRHPMDLLMVGANGFSDEVFHHSAGHGSVILMLRGFEQAGLIERAPRIVLVVSSDKYLREPALADPASPKDDDGIKRDIDGYTFWSGKGERTRENMWLSRDDRIRADLTAASDDIQLYNPREEAVPIALVDFVICDCGVFPVRDSDDAKTQRNIAEFLAAVRKTQSGSDGTAMAEQN